MSAASSISSADLKQLMNDQPGLVVIDVLPADPFREAHLPTAENICVYESAFVSKVTSAHPDLLQPIVVYGEGHGTLEAEVAAEKLKTAGFQSVLFLEGGLSAWRAGGFPLEAGPELEVSPATGFFPFDTERSLVHWTGRNLFNHHTGTLRVSGGGIELRDGIPVGGSVQLDMNSLANTDLADSAFSSMLIAHLRDEDFFAVARFPLAEFLLLSADPISDARPGIPNFQLTGELTLRGITRPLSFPAVIARKSDGTYAAQALITIDRTEWRVLYGSSRFFARLGEHVVNDHIHLHLKIFTL